MSILSAILHKIFDHRGAQAAQAAAGASTAAPAAPPPTAQAGPQSRAAAPGSVDVDSILAEMASRQYEKLNWRTSIVDLMKTLGLDSGLAARQELARELGYGGDMKDSAAMNVWLQAQVMRKFAENGGRVPPELLH